MKKQKIAAAALAALLTAVSFTSCTKPSGNGDQPDDKLQNNVQTPVDSNALTLEEISAQAESKVGKSENDSKVLLTLGDYNITYSEYRYYYINYIKQFAQSYGANWHENEENKALFDELFNQAIKMNALVNNLAKSRGVSLTQEEFDTNVLAIYDEITTQFGEDIESILDETYAITPYYLIMNETIYNLYSKLYDVLYGVDGENYEAIKKQAVDFYAENDYVHAKHILLQFPENDDGSEATDEQKAETLATAEVVLTKATAGDDFDALIEEYNQDPGMQSNPGGYYFTKGEMVEAFETATYALPEGGISGIVETPYGYHIIKRLPLDDAAIVSADKYNELAYTEFDEYFVEQVENSTYTEAEGFEKNVKPIYEEAEAYIAELVAQEQAAETADAEK